MKDGCGCIGTPQEQAKALDLGVEVEQVKRERQAVLQRVRRQRARIMRRLAEKFR
jgi:tRNA uridine 5-carbamoylmethylation protein Kti12